MFDCVMPTRAGRHGQVFTRYGRINLRNARHADDPRAARSGVEVPPPRTTIRAPICTTSCEPNEILGMMLLTWNNLAYYQDLMAGLRKAIAEGRLEDYVGEVKEGWAKGERDGQAEPLHPDNLTERWSEHPVEPAGSLAPPRAGRGQGGDDRVARSRRGSAGDPSSWNPRGSPASE